MSNWYDKSWTERVAEESSLTIKTYPSEIPGIWVAEILEIDLVSQGEGPGGAIQAVGEALEIVLKHESV